MLFVTYLRVSTDRQGKSGLGLEAQRAAVADHVAGKGEIAAEYVEIESGKKNDRPQLACALAEAKRIGAVLLIAKLDRLARNVAFIANLLEAGVEIAAADMPEANRFLLHVMAAVAEHEAQAISDRTRAALAAAKARGVALGWSMPGRAGEQRHAARKGAARNARKADQHGRAEHAGHKDCTGWPVVCRNSAQCHGAAERDGGHRSMSGAGQRDQRDSSVTRRSMSNPMGL
jgi:DNA invertase Pin-like site-specific DNA recombinase